jgi:hypothetical protein
MLAFPPPDHPQKSLGPKFTSRCVGQPGRGGLLSLGAPDCPSKLLVEGNGEPRDRHTVILLRRALERQVFEPASPAVAATTPDLAKFVRSKKHTDLT